MATGKYGSDTSVSVERSRMELETTLKRYGASSFAYMTDAGHVMIGFKIRNRTVRFNLVLPDEKDPQFALTPARRNRRSDAERLAAHEKACRQKWRALNLVVKAKLEAVESEISTFEAEFLANIVVEGGQTVGERIIPELQQLRAGAITLLLPGESKR